MIDELLRLAVRWQAEVAVLGAGLVLILVVAVVYAVMCRLVAWIWRTLGPPAGRPEWPFNESSRGACGASGRGARHRVPAADGTQAPRRSDLMRMTEGGTRC